MRWGIRLPLEQYCLRKQWVNFKSMQIQIQVIILSASGQLIEIRRVSANQTYKLGENYRAGIYLIEAIQGNQRKTLKVIKQ